jgi:hypothetical protein
MIKIKLEEIRVDCGTQLREKMDESAINDYSEAVKNGDVFPPVTVFFHEEIYYLADGFHRYYAYKNAGKVDIECTVEKGELDDAKLFAAGSNGRHGVRRTSQDKRNAVLIMLANGKWGNASNRQIAKHCNVSYELVNIIRKEVENKKLQTKPNVNSQSDNIVTNSMQATEIKETLTDKDELTENNIDNLSKNYNETACKPRNTQDEGIKNSNENVSGNEEITDDEMPSENETLLFEIEELRKSNKELEAQNKTLLEKNTRLEKIFATNDKLKEAMDDADSWRDKFINQILILNTLQIDLNEHKKSHAYWKKQAGKLKFELDKIKRETV